MQLLAQRLFAAGVEFISARGRHGVDTVVEELVCASQEDVERALGWAAAEGVQFAKPPRVATLEELQASEQTF
jgi:hypothetical protein